MRHGTHSHTPPQDCTVNIRCKTDKKGKTTQSANHLRLNRKKKYQDRAIERAVTFCPPRSRPGSPGSASAGLRRRRCRNRQSRRLFSAVRPGGLAESRGHHIPYCHQAKERASCNVRVAYHGQGLAQLQGVSPARSPRVSVSCADAVIPTEEFAERLRRLFHSDAVQEPQHCNGSSAW